MTLTSLLFSVTAVVACMLLVAVVGIVGLDRLRSFRPHAAGRLRAVLPSVLLLCAVLSLNSLLREFGPELSWIIGWRITGWIASVEGTFVATVQSYAHPALTTYFSYVYVYGYVFLVAFPVVAYFVLPDTRPFREVTIAYSLNYAIGVVCYLLFIAYGPRNVMPDMVDQLLYTAWPESQLLTSEVNANVNVFPSLHTSLSVTVAALAYRTRDRCPGWLPVAAVLAVSVAVSTIYLGIHWGIDVLAGLVLAGISVASAAWLTSPERQDGRRGRLGRRLRRAVDRSVEYLLGVTRPES
jgi:membrane-associated phospholipid phosphatase